MKQMFFIWILSNPLKKVWFFPKIRSERHDFLPPPKQLTIEATYIHTSELGEELFLIDNDQQQKDRDAANQEIDKRKAREEGFMLKQNQDIIIPR